MSSLEPSVHDPQELTLNEMMEAHENSMPIRQVPLGMQETSNVTLHNHESNAGCTESLQMKGSQCCDCVKEDNYQDQEPTMGSSSISSTRGRTPQRTPSSPESTAQKSPLQTTSSAPLIFERSVQEDILLPQTSPSIPSHIRTEDHIPPVLEASSAAITDNLDPDAVEIITHNIHHPATNEAQPEQPMYSPSLDQAMANIPDSEELPSTSSNAEAHDIRRLSFISFADVVNAENAETGEYSPKIDSSQRDTVSPNRPATVRRNISPSSLHSPVSSHGFGTSPPTSISASFKGLELSPNRLTRGAESPLFAAQRPVSPSFNGDLNIETMSQALRRTGSGDLGVSRNSLPNMTDNSD
ncbi:hypothetical protein BDV18DRAFT_140514 [Aspergillus unguis]